MGNTALKLTAVDGVVRFEVHAKPRAKKSRIGGVRPDGSLEIALAAPPVEGAANEELVRFLSKALGLPRRSVELVRGHTSQKKLLAVRGLGEMELDDLLRRLGESW